MEATRNYNQMTADEKKHSIELWNKFYSSQMRDDFNESWRYYLERLNYLQKIGVDVSDTVRRKWHDRIENRSMIQ